MRKYAVIVAGGKGLRMGGDVPKQFLPVQGKPVLMRTLERFHTCDETIGIILVLPKEQQAYWHSLCRDYAFSVPYRLADGGETRFHSVTNGLSKIETREEALVAVHDGVRPFVDEEVIRHCYEAAAQYGAVVPVVAPVETVRQLKDGECDSCTVDRSLYRLVQTPQVFRWTILEKAYSQPFRTAFTDDASVVEAMGERVMLVPGNRENIKITTPFDLLVAEALLSK